MPPAPGQILLLAALALTEAPIRPLPPTVPPGTPTAAPGAPQDPQPAAFDEASLATADERWEVPVAAPWSLRVYGWAAASDMSWVVEVLREGQRHGLYTHVDHWVGPSSVSADGRYLFLSNHKLQADGAWQQLRRIVRLEDKRAVDLPRLDCTERGGAWDGDRLLTWGQTSAECCPPPGLSTPVCAWSPEGDLLAWAEVHACWHAANTEYLASQMGLLPASPDVLWLYEGDCPSLADPEAVCTVHLRELTGAQRSRDVPLPGLAAGECPEASAVKILPGASTFELDAWSVLPTR